MHIGKYEYKKLEEYGPSEEYGLRPSGNKSISCSTLEEF